MDYKKHYDLLINRAKGRILEEYKESHHIIPRCMGGSDDSSNLVVLTAREHYIAHLLLVKIYPKHYGIVKAAMMMSVCSNEKQERCINNRTYGWLKELHSEAMSKSQKGKGNSQFGKMWICNLETKENKKIPKYEPIPNGWVKGRNKWNQISNFEKCGIDIKYKKIFDLKYDLDIINLDSLKNKIKCYEWLLENEPHSNKQLREMFSISKKSVTFLLKKTGKEIKEKRGGSRK